MKNITDCLYLNKNPYKDFTSEIKWKFDKFVAKLEEAGLSEQIRALPEGRKFNIEDDTLTSFPDSTFPDELKYAMFRIWTDLV